MPEFIITTPDGKKLRVKAPEGATREEALARVKAQYSAAPQKTAAEFQADASKEMTGEMSGLQKFGAGFGKAFPDLARGGEQLARGFAAVSPLYGALLPGNEQRRGELEQEQALVKERDAPLMATGAGMAGNIAGNAIGTAPMMMIPGMAGYKGAAATGAVFGAMQPTTPDDSRAMNTAVGAGAGMAGQALGSALRGVQAVMQPLYSKGRDQIVGRYLKQVAGENADDVINRLASAKEIVPGSLPTAGQASANAGIAAAERSAAAANPTAYTDRYLDQNTAIVSALRKVGGTEDDIAKAVTARSEAVKPLYKAAEESAEHANVGKLIGSIDRTISKNPANKKLVKSLQSAREALTAPFPLSERGGEAWKAIDSAVGKRMSASDATNIKYARTIMDRVRKGSIGIDDARAELRGLTFKSKTAQDAFDTARRFINRGDTRMRTGVQELKSASDHIANMMDEIGPGGTRAHEAAMRELVGIKKNLDKSLAKAEPAYGQALKTFGQMSQPVNKMRLGNEIIKKGTSPNLNVRGEPTAYLGQLSRTLRDIDSTAGRATGYARAKAGKILSASDRKILADTVRALEQNQSVQSLGRGPGSDTFQKFSMDNLLRRTGLPLAAREFPGIGRAGDWIFDRADEAMKQRIQQALLNPQETARLMQGSALNPQQKALAEALRIGANAGMIGASPMVMQ